MKVNPIKFAEDDNAKEEDFNYNDYDDGLSLNKLME